MTIPRITDHVRTNLAVCRAFASDVAVADGPKPVLSATALAEV